MELTLEPPRRRTLAQELDRFGKLLDRFESHLNREDAILDALAEGLPGVVSDAARGGMRQVVKDVLLELLSQPELRRLLFPPPPLPMRVRHISVWERTLAALRSRWSMIGRRVAILSTGVRNRYRALREVWRMIAERTGQPLPVKRIAICSVAVGIIVAVGGLFAPSTIGIMAGALGASLVAAMMQCIVWIVLHAGRVKLSEVESRISVR